MDIHEYESVCILDFDGTLAPIVEDPASARLYICVCPHIDNYIVEGVAPSTV